MTALPAFWPFPHFKLKSRVLFAPLKDDEAGDPFDDVKKQHRLRRTVCKGWRNKQWHGRIMAFIEMLSGELSLHRLPLAPVGGNLLEAAPILFTSPVSTSLPNAMSDEEEEPDSSTLGRPEPEDEAVTNFPNALCPSFIADEPNLEFGSRQTTAHPKDGLFLYGPHNKPKKTREIRIGVIGTSDGINLFRSGRRRSRNAWKCLRPARPRRKTACISPIFREWKRRSASRSTRTN